MTKNTSIIIVGLCIASAIGVTLYLNKGKSEYAFDRGDIQMLCSACGHSFMLTSQEYDEMVKKRIQEVGSAGGSLLECPSCSKIAAQEAMKCPECGNVFLPDWGRQNDYPDRCPKCRFSGIEQDQRKQ